MNARDLILGFDSGYDIPLKHNECLGALMQIGAFEPPDASLTSPDALAVFVGASWCRMVSHDVRYELADSLQAYLASRNAAERLLGILPAAEGTEDLFAAYAAARWQDGAGKCQYRVSRYRQASHLFRNALDLAELHNLWWVIPDVCSNQLRASQEADRVAAGGVWDEKTKEQLSGQIAQLKSEFEKAPAGE